MPEDYFLMGCFLPSFFILAFSPFCFFLSPFVATLQIQSEPGGVL